MVFFPLWRGFGLNTEEATAAMDGAEANSHYSKLVLGAAREK